MAFAMINTVAGGWVLFNLAGWTAVRYVRPPRKRLYPFNWRLLAGPICYLNWAWKRMP